MHTCTSRITFLGTPEFKKYLQKEAKDQGISLSELIRLRCEKRQMNDDEEALRLLLDELQQSTFRASKSLDKALSDVQVFMDEIKNKREEAKVAA